MDWSASHCRPIAQQRAKIVTARAVQRSTLARVAIECPRVNGVNGFGRTLLPRARLELSQLRLAVICWLGDQSRRLRAISSSRLFDQEFTAPANVADASQTAARSQGDLTIARHVKDVAAVHSTLWPEEPQQSKGTLAPLSIYSEQTVIAMPKCSTRDAQ